MRKACEKKGHKFKEIDGVFLPYVFCARLFCNVSAVSGHNPPEIAVSLHNAIPREKRFPRVELSPDGSVKEEF